MAVPDYQSLMLPLLTALADRQEHALGELRDELAATLSIGEEDRVLLLPSGKQTVYDNRFGWARTYMDKAGLMRSVRRAVYQITDRGLSVLASKPAKIDIAFLSQFPEFEEFARRRSDQSSEAVSVRAVPLRLEHPPVESVSGRLPFAEHAVGVRIVDALDPQESLDASYQELRRNLATELLSHVRSASFRFFERLVVELLVAMGYGGSLDDTATVSVILLAQLLPVDDLKESLRQAGLEICTRW